MKQIGLLSDTHGYIDKKTLDFFNSVDEIWHAGDIGSIKIAEQLKNIKPLRAVYGNIDDTSIRNTYPEKLFFTVEQCNIFMTHIGGYPGKYSSGILPELKEKKPDLFICGHSHILKVQYDPKLKLMHLNPGAAGRQGFHLVRTALKFNVNKNKIEELEVFEIDPRKKSGV
jgi:hypothetical protein